MSVDPGVLDANVLAYAVKCGCHAARVLTRIAGCGQRSFGNALRHVADTVRLVFVDHQPRLVAVVSSSAEALNIIAAMLALPGLYVLPTPARAVAG